MRVTASMATINRKCLNDVVLSIAGQVDHLQINDNTSSVMLEPFQLLENVSLNCIAKEGYGDQAKFIYDGMLGDYHLTLDDDIIYPADYVQTMVRWLKEKPVVSAHGVKFQGKTDSYYLGTNKTKYRYANTVLGLKRADVIGTGVMAMVSDLMPPIKIFKSNNMADIYYSKWLHLKGINRYVIPHKSGWIRNAQDYEGSIYNDYCNNDAEQTELVNTILR